MGANLDVQKECFFKDVLGVESTSCFYTCHVVVLILDCGRDMLLLLV